MIESKTLGAAAGIQRQDVIDNSETTVLPSLDKGVIVGRFKRGRMDKAFMVTAINYQSLLGYDPSNASYLVVEDAFKRGVSQLNVMRTGSSSAGAVMACVASYAVTPNDGQSGYVITVSRNGGEFVTFDTNSDDTDWAAFAAAIGYGQDGTSLAFIDASYQTGDAYKGVVGDHYQSWCGINSKGAVRTPNGDFGLLSIDIQSRGDIYNAPHTLRTEHNWLVFKPTAGVDKENDMFYNLSGSESSDTIEVHSCAVLVLNDGTGTGDGGVVIDPIPTIPVPSSGVRIRTRDGDTSRNTVLYEYHPENIGNGGENNLNVGNLFANSAYNSVDVSAKIRINANGWSDWSDPIIFDDVNHENSGGYLGVSYTTSKSPNSAIEMAGVKDSEVFAQRLIDTLNQFSIFEYRNFGGSLSVATLSTNPPSPPPSNLVAIPTDALVNYAFNGNYVDSSNNNVPVTTEGLMDFAEGRKAGTLSLQFAGAKILTDTLVIGSNKITVSFWVKGSQSAPAGILYMGGNNGFHFLFNNHTNTYDLVDVSGDSQQEAEAPRLAYDDKWTFIVGVLDRSSDNLNGLVIYANNKAISNNSWSRKPSGNFSDAPLLIGIYENTRFPFEGFLQDVRLYNRVLTADEMTALYYE